jgi:hypothetical protein
LPLGPELMSGRLGSGTYNILKLWILMKRAVIWDITQCSPVKVNERLGDTYLLHLQGRKVSQASNQHEIGYAGRNQYRFIVWFTLWPWKWRLYVSP